MSWDKKISLQKLSVLISIIASSQSYAEWPFQLSESAGFGSPLIIDWDSNLSNSFNEIVLPDYENNISVISHTGTLIDDLTLSNKLEETIISSPTSGDVDGDGDDEIIIFGDDNSASNATIAILSRESNNTLSQLTYQVSSSSAGSGKATACIINCKKYDGSSSHPGEEILVRDGNGKLTIVEYDGSSYSNLAVLETLPGGSSDDQFRDQYNSHQISSSVSAKEISGTDDTYIVTGSTDGEIYQWLISSSTSTNFSTTQMTTFNPLGSSAVSEIFSSVSLADFDDDSDIDIVVTSLDGDVSVWKTYDSSTGSSTTPVQRTGFPYATGGAIYSSPAIADVDEDGSLQIIFGNNDGNVYCLNDDGTLKWEVTTGGDVFASPVVDDLDGYVGLETVVGSFDGKLYVWDSSGDLLTGWPKDLQTQLISSPAISDLHSSLRRSIIQPGVNGKIFVFDLDRRYRNVSDSWPMFRGNAKRQGSN